LESGQVCRIRLVQVHLEAVSMGMGRRLVVLLQLLVPLVPLRVLGASGVGREVEGGNGEKGKKGERGIARGIERGIEIENGTGIGIAIANVTGTETEALVADEPTFLLRLRLLKTDLGMWMFRLSL